jgi:hypothetical protein
MHFYYVSWPTSVPKVELYEWDNGKNPIAYDSVEALITKMARNARTSKSDPAPSGDSLSGAIWTRKAYIVILIDDPNWSLVRYGPKDRAAVIFVPSPEGVDNHSFFDGADMKVDMKGDGTEFRSSVYFINHMKADLVGNDLNYESDGSTPAKEEFEFEIYYSARLPTGRLEAWREDPTDTNQGPPVGPP